MIELKIKGLYLSAFKFHKYSANGNDFIILDHPPVIPSPTRIQQLCHRLFGIGADGVLILSSEFEVDGRMQIFNADGGEAEMCANGLRCLFTYLDHQLMDKKESYRLATMNGIYGGFRQGESFAVEMSELKDKNKFTSPFNEFARSFYINTGVPQLVFLCSQIEQLSIKEVARKYRYHPTFPQGTNVNFVEIIPDQFQAALVRTYERGVEDETYSCGTGLTATSLALVEWLGWQGKIKLTSKGGEHLLQVGEKVFLSGDVSFCFQGEVIL